MAIELTPDRCAEIFAQHLDERMDSGEWWCPLEAALFRMGIEDPHVDYHYWAEQDEDGEVTEETPKHPLEPWAERMVKIADAKNGVGGPYRFTGREALAMLDEAMKED